MPAAAREPPSPPAAPPDRSLAATAAEATWVGVVLLLTLIVTVGALSARTGLEKISGPGQMVRKTAHRPYVYRQLAPAMIRAVEATRPPAFWRRLEGRMVESGFVARFERWTDFRYKWWRREDLSEIFLGAALNLLSIAGFAFAYRALLRSQIEAPEAFHRVVSAGAVYGLLFMTREGVYVYDYPQLLLFTLGLLLLARRRWLAYYPLLPLAALNKETAILLPLAFAALFAGRLRRRALALHLGAQVALCAAVRLALQWAFRDSPGAPLERHFFDHNVRLLVDPPAVTEWASLILVVALVAREWSEKPRLLRRATIMLWPLLGAALLFGFVDELRDYYEVYPLVIALAGFSAARWLGAEVRARPEPAAPGGRRGAP